MAIGRTNAVGAGGVSPTELNTLVGFVWGKVISGTMATVGAGTTNASYANVDSDYFTYSNGVFTCTQAGTYALKIYGAGQYSGGIRRALYQLIQNHGGTDTTLASDTTTGIGVDGGVISLPSVSVAVGDTLTLQMRVTGSSNYAAVSGALSICVTPSATVMSGTNNIMAALCSNGATPAAGTAGTYYLVGVQADQAVLSECDTGCFTYDAGYFTCVKPGTYTVASFSSAGRTESTSTTAYSHYKIVKTSGGTDTIVYENTTSIPLSGNAETVQVTLAEGDKLSAWVASISSMVRVPGGLVISVV